MLRRNEARINWRLGHCLLEGSVYIILYADVSCEVKMHGEEHSKPLRVACGLIITGVHPLTLVIYIFSLYIDSLVTKLKDQGRGGGEAR